MLKSWSNGPGKMVEPFLVEAQMGFRNERGCIDAIFALSRQCKKTIEYNKNVIFVFLDQEKAFDGMNRTTVASAKTVQCARIIPGQYHSHLC